MLFDLLLDLEHLACLIRAELAVQPFGLFLLLDPGLAVLGIFGREALLKPGD